MAEYSHISKEGRIGGLTIKNRVSMSPMEKQWGDRVGNPTQFYVDFMEKRAKHGVGMITMESTFVHPRGRGQIWQLGLWDDRNIEPHARLTDAVRKHGTRAVTEIMHAGRQASTFKSGLQPEAQSPIPCEPSGGYIPREVDKEDMARIRECFRQAARRAVQAGYDMITIHGAHGYIITGFLSPKFNQRTDEYGGSEQNRWRFPTEIYDTIRQEVGGDVPVGIRLSATEDLEGGMVVPQTIDFVNHLTERGLDYVDVSAGVYESAATIIQPMDLQQGCLLPIAREVKQGVSIPVIGAGRVNDMDIAERAIESGDADYVHMGRAFHCDPEIYEKSIRGDRDQVIGCIACNKCIGELFINNRVVCTVNPAAGRERQFALKPVKTAKRVMVVGGGMAGMEAAQVAASRGHNVTLYEKSQQLGGHIKVLSSTKNRRNWWRAAQDRIGLVERAGVRVEMGVEVDAAKIRSEKPDVLIIATGSKPFVPPYIPGIDQDHVTTYQDLINGHADVGVNVVVMGGQELGLTTAEYLNENGASVTIVDIADGIGQDIEGITSTKILPRIEENEDISIRVKTNIEEIGEDTVTIQSDGQMEKLEDVDQVVYAWYREVDRDLVDVVEREVLDDLDIEYHVIGDAVWPRHPFDAVNEGALVGRRI